MESNLNLSRLDTCLEKIAENKSTKLNQIKKEQELQELSQCSFKPKTTTNMSKSTSQVDVRGMNKYMENVNRKKRLDEAKEERKREVFGMAEGGALKTYYTTDDKGKYTKPQPFNIRERDESKIWALKEEIEQDFNQKYTFKPSTLEGVNKHLIMEVLNDES